MKQIIMEKLFNGNELTNQEILFIGKNLSNDNIIPFNHNNEDSGSACGLTEEDADDINREISKLSKKADSLSKLVELVEIKALSDERILRAVVINSLKKDSMPSIQTITGSEDIANFIKNLLKKGGRNEENSD